MQAVLLIALSNAVVATVLALLAAASRPLGRPALTHALWLLVLVKLVTPPLFRVPLWLADAGSPPASPLPRAVETERLQPRRDLWPGPQDTQDIFVVQAPIDPDSNLKSEISNHASAAQHDQRAGVPAPTAEVRPAVPLPPPVSRPTRSFEVPWTLLALLTWALGSLLCVMIIARRLLIFRRALRLAAPAPLDVQRQADLLARRLGMEQAPQVLMLPGPLCPMLIALGRPRLLLPATLWPQLDEDQRQSLLLHELAHLRRRDHWVRILETTVTVAYWWLPTAWAARRALREAEEQCCDAWVLWAMPGPRGVRAYATALLETLDFTSRSHATVQGRPLVLPALASGLGEFHQLKRRLIMIKHARASRRLSWGGGLLVAGLMAALPLSPSVAQVAEDQPGAAPAPAVEPVPPQPPADPIAPVAEVPSVAPVPGIEAEGPYITGAAAPRPGKTQTASATAAQPKAYGKGPAEDDDDDAREELEEAQRELREAEQELKKAAEKLAKIQAKFHAKGPMPAGRATTPRAPAGKMPGPGAANRSPDGKPDWGRWEGAPREADRERRLAQLESQLAALLGEVRALRQESGARNKPNQPNFKPMPDPTPKKESKEKDKDKPATR